MSSKNFYDCGKMSFTQLSAREVHWSSAKTQNYNGDPIRSHSDVNGARATYRRLPLQDFPPSFDPSMKKLTVNITVS